MIHWWNGQEVGDGSGAYRPSLCGRFEGRRFGTAGATHALKRADVTCSACVDAMRCSACGDALLFSARVRDDGLCGPCSRHTLSGLIRRTWRYAWQRARQAQGCGDDSVLMRTLRDSVMGRHALEALRRRALAREDDERNEPHPCLVGLVEQSKTTMAVRALVRRGWTYDMVKSTKLDLVNTAARLIRALVPLAGTQHPWNGLGGGVAAVQHVSLIRLNGQLVPAVFFVRTSTDGALVYDAVTLNVWRQRTRPLCDQIVCQAAAADGIVCPPDSCDQEDGVR